MHVIMYENDRMKNKYEKDRMKNSREKVATPFSPLYPMGDICCHGNQSSDPILPKT